MTKECDVLYDVMIVVGEICILVKFSPKREHLLTNITDNIEKEESRTFKKLKKLSATRWKVRAERIKRIIDNYESLLQLSEECLELSECLGMFCNCRKNVWKKSWTKKQRQGLWVARAKWNPFIFISALIFINNHQSIQA